MVVFKMRDSVPSARYSSVCNVLRQWRISLIPTYRVYRLYDRISVFQSIAIIVPRVIICAFYQCIVEYPCGFANILRILKTLLILSMDIIAFFLFCTAASRCKIDLMLKTGYIIP